MKKFVLFLMCATALTFAQVEEGSYQAVDQNEEQTQSEEQAAEQSEEASYQVVQSKTLDYGTVDSVEIYNNMVNRFEHRGNKLRSAGNGLIIGGGIGFGVGLALAIAGASNMTETCDDDGYDCTVDGDGVGLYVLGYFTACLGGTALAVGIPLKIVGGTQLNRAKRYRQKAEDYAKRQNAYLHVVPVLDPVNGRIGSVAMLDF